MSDIYSYSQDGVLSWSEPLKVKRYGILLAMRDRRLLIGAILVGVLLYFLVNWLFDYSGVILWISAFFISFSFSYFSLLKQLFISDQVMFEENQLSLKRNGVWTNNEYSNIRDVLFFSQSIIGKVYPMLSFIDENGARQQVIFLNEKQFEAIKEFMKFKEIIS